EPAGEEIAADRHGDHDEERGGNARSDVGGGHAGVGQQPAQVLGMPEDEEPPSGEAERADDGGAESERGDGTAEEGAGAGPRGGGGAGQAPGGGLGHLAAYPENEDGRQDADEEDPALERRREDGRKHAHGRGGEEDAEVDAALEDGGD